MGKVTFPQEQYPPPRVRASVQINYSSKLVNGAHLGGSHTASNMNAIQRHCYKAFMLRTVKE